jgi:hypothetical protein
VVRRLAILVLLLAAGCADDDGGSSDAGAELQSCQDLFGDAPVYRDCGGDETSCAFHAAAGYVTCDAICAELGAACAESYRTENGCDLASPDLGCDHPAAEHVCVCLRP